jgi:flagellar P-ring protein precursor FlgI
VTRITTTFLILISCLSPLNAASRVKDIAFVQNSRDNQLIGYGLVIGLQGTGDGFRNSPFTEQSVRAMLDNLGISTAIGSARTKNVAAVIVTATLPPFSRSGARIDVSVSSLGDATSLAGGMLIETQMKAADNQVYAVAQGSMIVSGFQAAGQAETVTQGVPTAGRVPNGAIVERNIIQLNNMESELTFLLHNPDFSTSVAMAIAMNEYTRATYGKALASAQDARAVVVKRPEKVSSAQFIAHLEQLEVETETPARVVVDERTGTIVIGADVKVAKVAVSHGALTVRVTELPTVSQPAPFSDGQTTTAPSTIIDVSTGDSSLTLVDGVDLETLVDGLNRMGAKPAETIAILQSIKSAGALQAELVSQ